MKGKTTTAASLSLAGIAAIAVTGWQLWPAIDGVFFFEAEASDVQTVNRRKHYETKRDIARLELKHETDPEDINKLKDEIDYYTEKLREIDDGETR